MMRRSLAVAHGLIQFGLWLLLFALLSPADAAEHVTLPVSAHMLRHGAIVGCSVGALVAFALLVAALKRKTRS